MLRLPPWMLVTAVWAAIYLPALGSFEIKGEEGRRILPAMAMLESGNYLVPHVGGDIYFSKPPLVNWLVAGSFKLFGIRSEWTARLPSVLAVLAVAIAFITAGRGALGTNGATIAALIWLTTIGIIEKGRLVEIEAVYVSLSAIATICWISWWSQKRSPWLTWTVPWIWLGLGWLAKGPVHLIFFYAVVIAVLWRTRQLKALVNPAHFIGVAVMLAIFAAWAIPFLELSGQSRGLSKWSDQFSGRVVLQSFRPAASLSTLGRAIGQFLPWLLFTPLLRFGRLPDPDEKKLAEGLAWAAAVPLFVVSLVPVSAARYSLPVAAPFCWLLAVAFDRNAFVPLPWTAGKDRMLWQRVGALIVLIVAVSTLIAFPVMSHWPNKHEKVKGVAKQINAIVPENETLYAVDPGYQPFLFYVRARVSYLDRLADLPYSAHYFFLRENGKPEPLTAGHNAAGRAVLLSRITDYRNETVLVFRVGGG